MRKSVGIAINAESLEWLEYKVGDIDRVTALAYAGKISPLGAAMYRLILAKDESALIPASNILAGMMKGNERVDYLPFDWRLRISRQAIYEVMHPHCRTCRGAGEIRNEENGLLIVCPTCEGYGAHKYMDDERASGMGFESAAYTNKISRLMNRALATVTGEISDVTRALRDWLD